VKVFSGSSNYPLTEKVAKNLNLPLSKLEIHVFPDGEKRIRVIDRVVEEDCVVIQSTSTPANENYMELFFIIDSLRRSGAGKITAVIPYLGYQRQDHIFRDGEAVSLEVVIETLQSVGVSKIVTFDLHSIKIPELFKIPVLHISALPLFAKKIQKNNSILVSPDMGGIRRVKEISEILAGMPYAVIDKNRNLTTGKVEAVSLEGNVKGKNVVIVDDMISSGKTIVEASKLLLKRGAKKILVFATHAVFSKNSGEILENSPVEKVFVTDTIDVPQNKRFPKLEIISVAEMIAKAIRR